MAKFPSNRGAGAGAGAKGKGKGKTKTKKNAGGAKGETKREARGDARSKKNDQNSKSNPSQSSSHMPPWQIMSAKDAKDNIASEKLRREGIRNGEISSSVTSLDEKIGDVHASSSLLTTMDRQMFNWKRFTERDITGMIFEGGYLGKQLPPKFGVPEVAFLGRSNVGKSSLLNKLSKRASDASASDTARVGQTPGATASVNLYSLMGKNKNKPLMAFADLPGFGYAKLSKDVKESVEMAAERYLSKRKELALGILLVDIRRVPSDDDRAVLAALYDMGVPLLVVATKVDKIRSNNALPIALEEIRLGLGLPEGQPLCISSSTGAGVKQLWSIILDACEDKIDELREVVETGGKQTSTDDDEEYDTIQVDDEGNLMEEPEEGDEGFEWIQKFAYYDDSKPSREESRSSGVSENSRRKMKENEDMQAAENEAQKVKALKKVVGKMLREGKV